MKIGIIVDNPSRDLDYCTLLALQLIKLNHKVVLIPSNLLDKELPYLELDHIVLNFLRSGNISVIERLTKMGITISILETEGGLVNDESFMQIGYPTETSILKDVFKIFCWGNKFYEYYLSTNPEIRDKIALSGTPKSDLWHSTFDFYLKSKGENSKQNIGIKQSENFFIVNTNFTTINSVFNTVSELRDYCLTDLNYTQQEIDQTIEEEYQKQKDLIDTTLYLAEKLPNIKFVFRAHPFENEQTYIDAFAPYKLSNIIVSKRDLVNGLISVSLGVIHKSCSTGIEALIMNRNALSVSYKPYQKNLEQVEVVSTHYQTKEDVLQKCIEIINSGTNKNNTTNQALQRIISEAYFKIDGLAAARIADSISNNEKSLNNQIPYSNKYIINIFKQFYNRPLYKLLLCSVFKKPLSYSFIKFKDYYTINNWEASDKGFSANKVKENIQIFTTNYYKDLTVVVENYKAEKNDITPKKMASITIKSI